MNAASVFNPHVNPNPDDAPNAMLPVIVPPDNGSFAPIELAIVVAKFASSPNAAANSFKVSSAEGAPSIKLVICVCT